MVARELTEFALGPYRIGVAADFGPRITSLRRGDQPEVLAVLDDAVTLDHPGGKFHFRGGHRVWAAPERPEVTYADDTVRCEVELRDGVLSITAPPDPAGVVKALSVEADGDRLVIRHAIRASAIESLIAAWAITQLPLDGLALISLTGPETGPMANRLLALWPYTDAGDPRLQISTDLVSIEAREGQPLKIGAGPDRITMGYFRGRQIFVKESIGGSVGTAPDLGATSQVYVGQGFCELESLSGMVDARVEPATLVEQWWIGDCESPGEARAVVAAGIGT